MQDFLHFDGGQPFQKTVSCKERVAVFFYKFYSGINTDKKYI